MTKPAFDFRHYRVRSDGEQYRRLAIYITQVDGMISSIETCETYEAPSTDETCDISGFLDTYRDGSSVLLVTHENHQWALLDLANEFRTLMAVPDKPSQYYFGSLREQTLFQVRCGE